MPGFDVDRLGRMWGPNKENAGCCDYPDCSEQPCQHGEGMVKAALDCLSTTTAMRGWHSSTGISIGFYTHLELALSHQHRTSVT